MADMEALSFDISVKSGDAAKQLDSLASSLERVKKAVSGGLKLGNTSTQLSKLNEVLNNLTSYNAAKLDKLTKALSGLNGVGKVNIPPSLAKRVTDLSSAAANISSQSITNLTNLGNALQGFQGLQNISIPGISVPKNAAGAAATQSPTQAASQAAVDLGGNVTQQAAQGTASMNQQLFSMRDAAAAAAQNIRELAGHLASFGGAGVDKAASGLSSFTLNMAKLPMLLGTRLAGAVKNATASLGGLFTGLLRIAQFRLFRSVIKMFTEGMTQGLENLYYWSQSVGNSFASSMDRIATASQYVSNSFAAMASPLLEALSPAIDFVADKVVALFNLINQLFARLSGKSTYVAAKKVSATWKGAASDAGKGASGAAKKAAEEIKRYTLGFDELNILGQKDKKNSGSGGGSGAGGSGGSGSGAGDMFETLPIDSGISDFADRLKDLFNAGDWEGLGRLLGDKVNGIIDSIDWDGWGHKFGYAINGAVKTAYFFLDEVDFRNLGNRIAEFLNAAMDEIEFEYVGRLAVKPFLSLADTIIGVFEKLDAKKVGDSIHDFCTGIFDEVTEWYNDHDWESLGETFYNKIKDLWDGLDLGDIADSFWTMLGTEVRANAKFVKGFFKGVGKDIKKWWKTEIEGETWDETAANLWTAIGKALVKYNPDYIYRKYIVDPFMKGLLGESEWEDAKKAGDKIYKKIQEGVKLAFSNPAKLVDDFIITPIANALGMGSAWQDLKDVGRNLISGLEKGIDEFFKDPLGWLKAHVVDPIVDNVKKLFGINSPSTVMAEIGGYVMEGFLNGIKDFFKDPFGWVKKNITDPILQAIKGFDPVGELKKTAGGIKQVAVELTAKQKPSFVKGKEAFDGLVDGGAEKTLTAGVTTLFNTSKKKYEEVKDNTVTKSITGREAPSFTNARKTYTGLTNATATKTLSGIETKAFTAVKTSFNSVVTNTAKKTITGTSQKSFSDVWTWYRQIASNSANKTITGTNKKSFDNVWTWYRQIASNSATKTAYGKTTKTFTNTKDSYNGIYSRTATVTVTTSGTSKLDALQRKISNVMSALKKMGNVNVNPGGRALGGIFEHGAWTNIPQYAGGGTVHGSMFIAGENGPELVGHVGGRTEVLNRSQLAATMYASVRNALAETASAAVGALAHTMADSTNALSTAILYTGARSDQELASLLGNMPTQEPSAPRDDSYEAIRTAMLSSTERQNQLLREQNDLLQQILDKDSTVEITANSFAKAAGRKNRRDGRTIIPIST